MKFLELRHDFELDALTFGNVVAPLLHHYRTSPKVIAMAETIQVSMHLRRDEEFDGDAVRVWESATRNGKSGHIKTMSKLSLEIQRASRAWTSFLWCSDPALLQDRERTAVLATYWAMKPLFPKEKNVWTYDPLEVDAGSLMARTVRQGIEIQLERLATICRLRGEDELADYYSPKRATWFVDNVFRAPKMLWDLFERERKMIRVWGPLLGQPPAAEAFHEAREKCAGAWSDIMRGGLDWRFVTAMVENEAMAALEDFQELPVRRKLEILVEPRRDTIAQSMIAQGGKVIFFPKRAA
jgi:hypothetical protein